jgi:hypothetical protein
MKIKGADNAKNEPPTRTGIRTSGEVHPEVYLPVEIGAGIAAAGALTALTVIGVGLSAVVPRSLKPLLVNIGTAGTVAAIGGGLLAVGGVALGALEWAEGGIEDLF